METIILKVQGMSCGGCVKSVTGVLQKIPGVGSVDVSLEQNCATISYDPAKAAPAQFRQAIEGAGFSVG
ncbi:MAG TPA: cation transporter [Gallionella sp.]|nr:cation transporter [Gallionella sp.]